VHIVGFIIRIYHDARSPERQNVAQCFLLFNYRSDMFRPQFLANFSELICLCSLYAEVDIQAAQNYWLPEDGQELRPIHVKAIINQQKYCATS